MPVNRNTLWYPRAQPSPHLSQSEASISGQWPMRGGGWSPSDNGVCVETVMRWACTEPRGVSRVKVSHHAPSGVLSVVCPVTPVVSDQLSALNNRNTPTPKLWPDITHLAINKPMISSPALIRQNGYLYSLSHSKTAGFLRSYFSMWQSKKR